MLENTEACTPDRQKQYHVHIVAVEYTHVDSVNDERLLAQTQGGLGHLADWLRWLNVDFISET